MSAHMRFLRVLFNAFAILGTVVCAWRIAKVLLASSPPIFEKVGFVTLVVLWALRVAIDYLINALELIPPRSEQCPIKGVAR